MERPGVGAVRAAVLAALTLAAMVAFSGTATANHYHTNCVGHGMVHGSSTTDGSFFARVEGGCSDPGMKTCSVRTGSLVYATSYIGTGNPATCNQWSNYCCAEQSSYATVDFNGVFSSHSHYPH